GAMDQPRAPPMNTRTKGASGTSHAASCPPIHFGFAVVTAATISTAFHARRSFARLARSYLGRGRDVLVAWSKDAFREGLGAPRRSSQRGRAGPRLHRSAPRPRGDESAGLRGPAAREAFRAAARARARDDGP